MGGGRQGGGRCRGGSGGPSAACAAGALPFMQLVEEARGAHLSHMSGSFGSAAPASQPGEAKQSAFAQGWRPCLCCRQGGAAQRYGPTGGRCSPTSCRLQRSTCRNLHLTLQRRLLLRRQAERHAGAAHRPRQQQRGGKAAPAGAPGCSAACARRQLPAAQRSGKGGQCQRSLCSSAAVALTRPPPAARPPPLGPAPRLPRPLRRVGRCPKASAYLASCMPAALAPHEALYRHCRNMARSWGAASASAYDVQAQLGGRKLRNALDRLGGGAQGGQPGPHCL